jgi:transcriptional regulator GlxA family with amidase domain
MEIAIPLYDRFTALDAVGPYEVLWRLPGARVRWVGTEARPYSTDRGLQLIAEATLDEVPAPDVLVVPGGTGTRDALGDERLVEWIRAADATSTWTTSVCTGALLLGAAGILDGLRATTHWAYMDALAAYGAEATSDRVVRQGKVITSAGVSSGIDMALTLAAEIAGADVAQAIQLRIEYDPMPPFDTGSTAKAPAHIRALAQSPSPASASASA